ncbi:trigger factor [Pseudidiomarina terrestris]|uniref:Trigger factor n=1 Tax=Pseudidiomarina terrestris TaxID=2820060 RepID=A0AAW7QTS2_9GAMM|nr:MULTISPECIES: trigger factor [unclassified Pseudidiomarina]MDN7123283.1 trigger factor [Pseudidiomarina sp. 1APP75-32.1]MDN7127884.1 trigger factor [Pseudidiomarina sp. 1APR75-33.1]MDN7128991.1 trigger factor [Pseudidiomarina sp. 1APR75-15]MDN7134746.1 trigger factor [Pseudidiomarina sp. 1ASP75-5]MDN7137424.1 trigger factor [Pseudidiomarina sp. 1ASP75-14]
MQVSVETTQGLERRATITVPAATIDEKVKELLKNEYRNRRINGFRKGKVPPNVLQKLFGKEARARAAQELMQSKYFEAIMQEQINPAGPPSIEPKVNEAGKDLEFVATFEVYPQVEVQGLDKIEVEKPDVTVTDEDVDGMLETLRKQHASWKEVKRKSKKGDRITIDFTGRIDGEEFDGGKAQDFALELGQGRMIPGFEDDIIGMKAGEEKTIEVTFPDDYHAENLKGKKAEFDIVAKKVEEQELPELNDEFVAMFGVTDGGVDALKAEVRKNMERELKNTVQSKVKEQVLKGLVENNDVDLPSAMVKQEIDGLRRQAMQRFGDNQAQMPELPANLFEEQAKERVKVGLLLGEVIRTNDIKVDDAKVDEIIANNASAYEDPEEVVAYYKGNDELLQQVRNVALEEQAVDFILDKAKVSAKKTSFDELMNPKEK